MHYRERPDNKRRKKLKIVILEESEEHEIDEDKLNSLAKNTIDKYELVIDGFKEVPTEELEEIAEETVEGDVNDVLRRMGIEPIDFSRDEPKRSSLELLVFAGVRRKQIGNEIESKEEIEQLETSELERLAGELDEGLRNELCASLGIKEEFIDL